MPTDVTDAGAAGALDRDLRLRMYRTMLECRLFEQRTHELFLAGLVRGTTHLGIGQEAVGGGGGPPRGDDARWVSTNSGPHHPHARGVRFRHGDGVPKDGRLTA